MITLTNELMVELAKMIHIRSGGHAVRPDQEFLDKFGKYYKTRKPTGDDVDGAIEIGKVWYQQRIMEAASGGSQPLVVPMTPPWFKDTPDVPEKAAKPAMEGEAGEWETKIKMMKWPEIEALCKKNGIELLADAPNPGVRVMRARNALYNHLKAGKKLS